MNLRNFKKVKLSNNTKVYEAIEEYDPMSVTLLVPIEISLIDTNSFKTPIDVINYSETIAKGMAYSIAMYLKDAITYYRGVDND